mgnify:CR=1 FL=1
MAAGSGGDTGSAPDPLQFEQCLAAQPVLGDLGYRKLLSGWRTRRALQTGGGDRNRSGEATERPEYEGDERPGKV